MELAIILGSLISTVGFIIIVILRNQAQLTQLGVKMDYKSMEYDYKSKIQKDKVGLQMLKLKQQQEISKQPAANNLLSTIGNLDLDQIQDILGSVGEMSEGAEDNPILSALNNPVVKGFLSGLQKKKEETPQLTEGNQELEAY